MKKILALGALCIFTGCATKTRVALGMPATTTVTSAQDLSGRYANVGWVHSPDENRAIEAYLDVTLGAANFPDAFRGSVVLRAEDDKIILLRVDGDRVIRESALKKNRDYRETAEGIELTHLSEGPGGEGNLSVKVTTTLLLSLEKDGTMIIKAHEDIRGVGGILFPLPYHDARDLWSEFKKDANQ